MIQVFITDLRDPSQANTLLDTLEASLEGLKINFDFSDTNQPFPCGHTILRTEGDDIHTEKLLYILNKSGVACSPLEERVCY
ncbi:hypothetical protein CLV98_109151 [Dyadobacter jejuensis]|uniref:Uncharacterized protein n=1 Tax=Dyadobacter jejuensis TaxID=1082580 RepID=A0A316AHD2_9BACT|nr:hypothetical protein [Dyadobacter jejuensis]PWJ57041.1 hypothetical protein CLV98_109151 [Dyadobacter jejuensis]